MLHDPVKHLPKCYAYEIFRLEFVFFVMVVKANILFAVALRPNAGHGLLILEVSRSQTTTHYSP
jgi:hypothetical protein